MQSALYRMGLPSMNRLGSKMRRRNHNCILIVFILLVGCSEKEGMDQKITNLSKEMKDFIDNQNNWARNHFDKDFQYKYETNEGKVHLLQGILDKDFYDKNDTKELQALGICFGEVLKEELNLHWVEVKDKYGKDPALKYKDTSIIFYPRTMISKRIEMEEKINIIELLDSSRKMLETLIDKGY